MNRMGAYVWARRGVLAAFLGCVLIFWLVFSLYELPGEAVLYAALLSSIWLLGLGVWDALRFSGRLRALQELRRDIDVTDAMPQARFACSTMSGRSSRNNGSPPEMISCDNPAAASPSTARFMSAKGASARRLRCSSSE